jgi:hypothetical protein
MSLKLDEWRLSYKWRTRGIQFVGFSASPALEITYHFGPKPTCLGSHGVGVAAPRDAARGWAGLWRAALISNSLFGVGIVVVVLAVLAGTTRLSGGMWAPGGACSRFVAPSLLLVCVIAVSRVLLTRSRLRGLDDAVLAALLTWDSETKWRRFMPAPLLFSAARSRESSALTALGIFRTSCSPYPTMS